MRRRALLRTAALAGAAGIAGCTSDGPSDGSAGGGGGDGNSPTDSPTDSPTNSPTDPPTDSPTDQHTATRTPMGNGMVGESFELTDRECGQGKEVVDITFDGDFVRLDGVITGSDACYKAEQESVVYDAANDRLSVNVRAYRPDDAGACADCIVDISYEARYTFEGETPNEVVVSHDGRQVASAEQGSARATEQGTVE